MAERKIFNIKKLPMDIGRITYFVFRVIPGVRVVKMPDCEKVKGPALVTANHMGLSDPHTMAAAFCTRRMHFIASKEVMNTGFFKGPLKAMGCIEVNRGIFDLQCIKNSLKVLKDGYLLGMFPQGTIVHTEEIDEIKSGAALIACKAGVPVIPMYIFKNKKRFYAKRTAVIGKQIDVVDYIGGKRPTNADIEKITQVIKEKMTECEKYAEKICGGDAK